MCGERHSDRHEIYLEWDDRPLPIYLHHRITQICHILFDIFFVGMERMRHVQYIAVVARPVHAVDRVLCTLRTYITRH